MRRFKDLTGMKFGRLTVIGFAGYNKHGQIMWRCRCECGNIKIVSGNSLKSGRTQSCGCLQRERALAAITKHGLCYTKAHDAWHNAKARCYNPNYTQYKDYGGRGIKMYEPWIHDFQAFFDYISALPHFGEVGYTLDRIDNDKNYEPGNLRWATRSEQQRNTRQNVFVEYNGEKMCLKEAAELSGVNYETLRKRIKAGDTSDRLFRPVK